MSVFVELAVQNKKMMFREHHWWDDPVYWSGEGVVGQIIVMINVSSLACSINPLVSWKLAHCCEKIRSKFAKILAITLTTDFFRFVQYFLLFCNCPPLYSIENSLLCLNRPVNRDSCHLYTLHSWLYTAILRFMR